MMVSGTTRLSPKLFLRYGAIGASGAAANLLGFAALIQWSWFEINYLAAAALPFLIWAPVAFFVQQKWVFQRKEKLSPLRFLFFLLAGVPLHFVGLAVLSFLVEIARLDLLLAQIAAAIIVAGAQFLTSWIGIFRWPSPPVAREDRHRSQ
jgi:putative flippase GtrA